MSESDEQGAVVDWFRLRWPQYLIFAVPNGTHIKSHAGRNKAKKEGLLSGVSDLIILAPMGRYHGMVLEMKDVGKSSKDLSKSQVKFLQYAHRNNYHAAWAAGCDIARRKISEYMNLGKHDRIELNG